MDKLIAAARRERTIPIDPQGHILLGWLLIVLLALPTAAWTTLRTWDKFAARSWPRATAQVLASELYMREGRDGRHWCVKLSYRYTVDGRAYTSRRIGTSRLGDAGCDRDRAVIAARLERLAPGRPLRIRYDPRDPATAVVHLEGFDSADCLFPVFAGAWGWAGWVAIREGKAARRAQAPRDGKRMEATT